MSATCKQVFESEGTVERELASPPSRVCSAHGPSRTSGKFSFLAAVRSIADIEGV
jgi:hypothetical protein